MSLSSHVASLLASCAASPDIVGASKEVNNQFGFVIYRAKPGTHFQDYTKVKRFYCPCDPDWWSEMVVEFIAEGGKLYLNSLSVLFLIYAQDDCNVSIQQLTTLQVMVNKLLQG